MSADVLKSALRKLAFGESLSAAEAADVFGVFMRGEATAVMVSAVLVALRLKGETAEEVAGVARALRAAMVELPAEDRESLVDTCGTGGGAVPTFNISTAAALLAAGAGVRVAKHGNRSFTSRCGSADVLEALGVPIEAPVGVMAAALASAGIVFMFAPVMHPAMRHVGPIRRELAIPTVMNVVGPLANPARAGRQVVGVAEPRRMPLLAGALAALGTTHALVVYGEPGMDEISPLGTTRVLEVRDGSIAEWTIDPASYGISGVEADELLGGDPEENARIIVDVLAGRGTRGAEASVLLNAGAALYVAGRAESLGDGIERAREALRAGAGLEALDRLRSAFSAERRSAEAQ